MFDTVLARQSPTVVVATVTVSDPNLIEALARQLATWEARSALAILEGQRSTNAPTTVTLSAIPERRVFEVTFTGCEANTPDPDDDLFDWADEVDAAAYRLNVSGEPWNDPRHPANDR